MTASKTNLQGKTAFVTGSTSGIGLAIAEALAANGCNIGLSGFGEPNEIQQIIMNLQEQWNVEAIYCSADLRKPNSIYEAVNSLIDHFGQIDILVNNAGVQHVATVQDFPTEKWDEILAVNLSAAFHSIKAVIPGMIENGWGRIVNISSVHGLVGSENKSAYVAAKHGVVGLTKVVAIENAQRRITCNAVCPGYVDTELIKRQIQDFAVSKGISYGAASDEMLSGKHPSKRFINASKIASLVVYLSSEEASGITGAALPVDGGWTAQ